MVPSFSNTFSKYIVTRNISDRNRCFTASCAIIKVTLLMIKKAVCE